MSEERVGYWELGAGHWALGTGYWELGTWYWVLNISSMKTIKN